MGGFAILDIVLLALIAGFIALRLRSVLGQRSDADDERRAEKERKLQERLKARDETIIEGKVISKKALEAKEAFERLPARLRQPMEAIQRIEPHFNPNEFLKGARSAYALVLEGFWTGDKDAFGHFLSEDIRKDFFASIDTREKEGHQLDNRLLETRVAEIEDVILNDRHAEITVRFVSDIIMITRDKDGEIIDGDLSDSVEVVDIWTFSRELGSRDPNWTLIETRAD